MALIFISHSSKDNQEILKYKKTLEDNKFISFLLDFDKENLYERSIPIGEKWEKVLYQEIKRSRIVLLFLTKNWFESYWCNKEYCMARSHKKRIISIVLDREIFEMEGYQSWDGKDIQIYDLTKSLNSFDEIIEYLKKLTKKQKTRLFEKKFLKDSPYPGLLPYNEKQTAIFFEREDEITELIGILNSMAEFKEKRLLLIIGASGIGKSSLLRAGIVPVLELLDGDKWDILPTFRAYNEPFKNIRRVFAIYLYGDSTEIKNHILEIEESLTGDEYKKFLDDRYTKATVTKNLLLPTDQVEELLLSNKEEKEQFFKIFSYLIQKDKFFTVWTIRVDFLKEFRNQIQKLNLNLDKLYDSFTLNPISKENLRFIINEPAILAKIEIEDGLNLKIIDDLKESQNLPILAYALSKLYEKAKSKKTEKQTISFNDYKELGIYEDRELKESKISIDNPLEGLIHNEAEKIIKQNNIDLDSLKRAFLQMVRLSADGRYIKQSVAWDEISDEAKDTLQKFINKRLLIKKKNTIEIAHEALINRWQRLQEWLNEEQEFMLFSNQLRLSYQAWEKNSKTKTALLQGLPLQQAKKYKSRIKNQKELDYINSSIRVERVKGVVKWSFVIGFILFLSTALFITYNLKQEAMEALSMRQKQSELLEGILLLIDNEVKKLGILKILKPTYYKIENHYNLLLKTALDDLELKKEKLFLLN